MNQYESGELAKQGQKGALKADAATMLTGALQGVFQAKSDHKLMVDGKNATIEEFAKALDQLFGSTAFQDRLERDKENSK